MAHAFSISIAGFRAIVECDSALLIESIEKYLLPWAPRLAAVQGSAALWLSVTSTEIPGRFAVRSTDSSVCASEAWPYLFAVIQQQVDEAVIHHAVDRAAVHAGVVALNGQAILLPGTSGSGKTTLVHELIRRGFTYLSDEYALIDSHGRVHPYPRALMVRDEFGEQHPRLPEELGAQVCREVLPPGLVLALSHRSEGDFEVVPLSHGECLLRLLQNTPQVLAERPEILGPLQALAGAAPCFAGFRGNAGEAADRILELWEQRGPTQAVQASEQRV